MDLETEVDNSSAPQSRSTNKLRVGAFNLYEMKNLGLR